MSIRLCEKSGKHTGRPIEAFCLEESCKKNRLLCFYCVFEAHTAHNIAYLHKELSGPISNLEKLAKQATSDDPKSQLFIQTGLTKMTKKWEKLSRLSSSKVSFIKNHFTNQFQIIKKLFKKSSTDQILKDLTSNSHLTQYKIEKYASTLAFYGKEDFDYVDTFKRNSEDICNRYDAMVDEAHLRIEGILNKLVDDLIKLDLTKGIELKQTRQEENIVEEVLIPQSISKECEFNDMNTVPKAINIDCLMEDEGGRTGKQAILAEDMSEENVVRQDQGIQGKQNIYQQYLLPVEGKSHSEYIISEVGDDRQTLKERRIVHYDYEDEIEEEEISSYVVENKSRMIEEPPKAQRNLRNNHLAQPQPQIVYILAPNNQQLNKMLAKINVDTIKELTITCDTRLNIIDSEAAIMISKMKKLTSLRVYWAQDLKDTLVIEMLKYLQNLTELVLSQFNCITFRLIQALKTNNFNLNRICFTIDYLKNIRGSEESMEFLKDIPISLVPQNIWINLTDSHLCLRNLDLYNPVQLQYWISYIKKQCSNLKEVTILQIQSKCEMDYTSLLTALSKCTRLQLIRLEQIQFQQESLIEVIKCNPILKSIVLSECTCITKKTYQAIVKHSKNLKTLSICLQDSFTGTSNFVNSGIETLILRGSWNIKEGRFQFLLSKLKEIKCLSLDHNSYWLTEMTLRNICDMKQLKILNISNNEISQQSLKRLSSLKNLNTLICSNNNFSYKCLARCMFSRKLKKLSISGHTSHEGDMEWLDIELVARNFPKLTHLRISKFRNISVQLLYKLLHLQSIVMSEMDLGECEAISKWCLKKKINCLII